MPKQLISCFLSICLAISFLPITRSAYADVHAQDPVSGALELNAKVVDESGNPAVGVKFALYRTESYDGATTPGKDSFGTRIKNLVSDDSGMLSLTSSDAAELSSYWLDTTSDVYVMVKSMDATHVVKGIVAKNTTGEISKAEECALYLGLRQKMTNPRINYFKNFAISSSDILSVDSSSNSSTTTPPESIDTTVTITVGNRDGGVFKENLKEYIDATVGSSDTYAAGYEKYTQALQAANSVYENADATQSDIDTAAQNLSDAIDGLIKFGPASDSQVKIVVIDENGKLFGGAQKFAAYALDDDGNPTDTIVADNIAVTGGYITLLPEDVNDKSVLIRLKDNDKYQTNDTAKLICEPWKSYINPGGFTSINGEAISYGSTPKVAFRLSINPGWVNPDSGGVKKGDPVNLADIPVVYEDGNAVEDGFTIDWTVVDSKTGKTNHSVVSVSDGKLKGLVTPSEYEAKLSILYTNQKYKTHKIIDSINGSLSIFGRYQNQLPLIWDASAGNEGEEKKLEKIKIKTNPQHDDATNANGGKSLGDNVDKRYDAGERPSDLNTTYNTLEVNLLTLPIRDENGDPVLDNNFKFQLFDATLQVFNNAIFSVNSALPVVTLYKDHHYILYLEDANYEMNNVYFTLNSSAADVYPIDDKTEKNITEIKVKKRQSSVANPSDDKRKVANFDIGYKKTSNSQVDYTADFGDCTFNFISQYDKQSAKPGNSNSISVNLIEDITYMVEVTSKKYTIDSFPVAMKNHDEIPYTPVLPYNHFICGSVSELHLIDKANAGKNNSPITSISKKTTVSGLNFMTSISDGQYLLNERILGNANISALNGKDYEVIDIDLLNMYRGGEISKLASGNFVIETEIANSKKVGEVFAFSNDGKLTKLVSSQTGNKLKINANTVSIDNYVVVYGEPTSVDVVVSKSGSVANANVAIKGATLLAQNRFSASKGSYVTVEVSAKQPTSSFEVNIIKNFAVNNKQYYSALSDKTSNFTTFASASASQKKVRSFKIKADGNLKIVIDVQQTAPVYRLYNTITSEHLFTTKKDEYDKFANLYKQKKDFWKPEGIDWMSAVSGKSVYRLYNPALGALGKSSHYYTSDLNEANKLVKSYGWLFDVYGKNGNNTTSKKASTPIFYSAGSSPVFTAYSEALNSAHHYTASQKEWEGLDQGWDREGVKNGGAVKKVYKNKPIIGMKNAYMSDYKPKSGNSYSGFFNCVMPAKKA